MKKLISFEDAPYLPCIAGDGQGQSQRNAGFLRAQVVAGNNAKRAQILSVKRVAAAGPGGLQHGYA